MKNAEIGDFEDIELCSTDPQDYSSIVSPFTATVRANLNNNKKKDKKFLKKEIHKHMVHKHIKRCLNLSLMSKMQIRTTVRYCFYLPNWKRS